MPRLYRLRRRGRRRPEARLVGWLAPIPDKATYFNPFKHKLRCYCRGRTLHRKRRDGLTFADMEDPERAQSDPPEGSELDAEGEEVDEEFEQSLANGFIAPPENAASDNENAEDGLHGLEAKADDASSQDEESSSASSVSEENEWQGSSHSEEDAESKTVDTNRCV
jgi:hypothetical protein